MNQPWYEKGLYFGCTGCGECCTGAPGFVWISQKEIKKISEFLGIPEQEFLRKYTRKVNGKISLKEHPQSYDCVFLRQKKCMIYPVRPKQCKTFPFWKENLTSKEAWLNCGQRCEGINHKDASLVPLSAIQKNLQPSKKEDED